MTEHPKNETEWSDDDHMERIFAAWVQSRPADAAATEATDTDSSSPEPPAAGATSADPSTEGVAAATNGGPGLDDRTGEEAAFPKSLAKKTSLPDWFVDEPSAPDPAAGTGAAHSEPSSRVPAAPPEPAAIREPAAFPEPAADDVEMTPGPWHDAASFPATFDDEPASPAPEATDKGAATSPGWTRRDDDVIPKGGKRRWGRKGR